MSRRYAAGRTVLLMLWLAALLVPGPAVAAPLESTLQLPPVPVEGLFTGSPPDVSAQAYILYDATFDRVLAEDNADQSRAMASTTKMMTALVVAQRTIGFERVTVGASAPEIGEAEIDLVAGEVWTVDELLQAMLLESANDAALAVAEFVGGTVEGFVKLMNEEASLLGLDGTSFTNPHGLDEIGHYSTARDLLSLARTMMGVDKLAGMAATRRVSLPPSPDGEERVAENTNRLLYDYRGATGVKTGYTDDAGWTLVASAERDGRLLYVVVMGAPTVGDRFADAAALLDYGFGQFGVVEVIVAGVDYARRRLPEETEPAAATETFSIFADRDDAGRIVLTPAFEDSGAVVIATLGDEELTRVPLETTAGRDLPQLADAFAWAGRYWDWIFGNE